MSYYIFESRVESSQFPVYQLFSLYFPVSSLALFATPVLDKAWEAKGDSAHNFSSACPYVGCSIRL